MRLTKYKNIDKNLYGYFTYYFFIMPAGLSMGINIQHANIFTWQGISN